MIGGAIVLFMQSRCWLELWLSRTMPARGRQQVMVSWSQHYHGQVMHWWDARSSICRREIGCQRSLVLELLRAALLMKSDATNAFNLCGGML